MGAAGCGQPQDVLHSGTTGVNGQVGPVLLRSVYVDAPGDIRYPVGADPRLVLTLLNQARAADALVSATSPYARAVRIRWDSDCDGSAQPVRRLPLAPAGQAPGTPPEPAALPFDPYHLVLQDLTREVLAGTSIPVVFTFQTAGEVQMDVPVQPSNASRPEPNRGCTTTASPAATRNGSLQRMRWDPSVRPGAQPPHRSAGHT